MLIRLQPRALGRGLLSGGLTVILAAAALLAPPAAAAATSGGWSNLGHGSAATTSPLNERVLAMTRVGAKLYVGGQFTNAGGIAAADRVAVWDGTRWAAVGAGITNGSVNAIAVSGNRVFVGGSFQDAGGDTNADNFAVWEGGAWHAVGGAHFNGPVWALAISGDRLLVGGGFDNADGIAEADGVASFGLVSGAWSAITAANGDVTGTVFALAPDGAGGAWVGGYFADVAGIDAADYIAHWTGGTAWSSLGGVALNGTVRGLAASGTGVTVVGDFTGAGGAPGADKAARFDGAWSALGSTGFFPAGTSLYGVALDGPRTIVAGAFLNAGGVAQADGVAIFDGTHWSNLGSNAAGTNGPATALRTVAVVGKLAYVGGLDTRIGGGALNVCAASFRLRQPDLLIRTTPTWIGNGIYSATAAKESRARTVARGKIGTFAVWVTNDGGTTDTIRLKGPASGAGFTATWRRGTTDITAQIVAGTYEVTLPPGARATLTLVVKVGSRVAHGTRRSWLLLGTSTGGGGPRDAVRAIVTVQ